MLTDAAPAPWLRARFKTSDACPVRWPPPAPSWCTGFTNDLEIVVAYVRNIEQVTEYWPDAVEIEHTEETAIKFYDRFPKPDWFVSEDHP